MNLNQHAMTTIQIKRVYEPPGEKDGFRILVDRLWPRAVKKEEANLDLWMKEVAPENALRKWFNHEPEKWESFSRKYKAELKKSVAVKELIAEIKKHKRVTLLYGAKDERHNQAVVLLEYITALLG
jgi:uncharacterized protein YeaO (DUF488 family)